MVVSRKIIKSTYGEAANQVISRCPRLGVRLGLVRRFRTGNHFSLRLPDTHPLGPRHNSRGDFLRRRMEPNAPYCLLGADGIQSRLE